jgi:amino acid transporter
MPNRLLSLLIGSPLPSTRMVQRRLNKIRALAAFSPGALSSIAYANQEIYLGLIAAGSLGLLYSFPIGVAIACVLVVVAVSYYQTLQPYPSGGGSYTVAKDNLGTFAGLIAASAIMIDYILTAAVSLAAGVEALASAFPALWPHRVTAALFLLAIMTILNLRGIQETGTVMSLPVYLFLAAYLGMLVYGLVRAVVEGPGDWVASAPPAVHPLTVFLVLRAFASGSTALTGIEAISNGVPAFKPPESKNAGRTLIVMAVLMSVLFLGSLGLTQYFAVIAGPQETILSALARRILDTGPLYYIVQISTLLILTVAANTAFAGFPQVASVLARDGFLPRQLTNLGDRLMFTNGILLLAVTAGAFVVLFGGDSHALIPLFAMGAFLAFTLSQAGMVMHWIRQRGRSWQLKSLINGTGAAVTAIMLIVVSVSKFTQGAWVTLLLIPSFVFGFLQIKRHYREVATQLSLRGLPPSLRPVPRMRLVIPISGVHRAVIDAVKYARSLSDRLTAVYIELEPGSGEKTRARWQEWFPDIPLVIAESPYRSVIGPLLETLDRLDRESNDGEMAGVVLPEIVPAHTWQNLLHNQSAWLIKAALLYRRRKSGFQRVIIDVPYHLKH